MIIIEKPIDGSNIGKNIFIIEGSMPISFITHISMVF